MAKYVFILFIYLFLYEITGIENTFTSHTTNIENDKSKDINADDKNYRVKVDDKTMNMSQNYNNNENDHVESIGKNETRTRHGQEGLTNIGRNEETDESSSSNEARPEYEPLNDVSMNEDQSSEENFNDESMGENRGRLKPAQVFVGPMNKGPKYVRPNNMGLYHDKPGYMGPSNREPMNVGANNEFTGKIVGGVPVPLEKYPFSVQVYNMGNMCAGTILNSWTVLTAAHCFDVNRNIDEITVHVGSRYSFDLNAISLNILGFVAHNHYNKSSFSSDIALIFVATPIYFSRKIKKAVLVNTDRWMNPRAGEFIVTGWGWTKYRGSISKIGLLKTHMKFVSLRTCSRLHQISLTEDMFCLYGDGVRDTCRGDSGGGVLWNDMIVGITSHGDGCARKDSPSVYTNVWHFRKWIEYHVRKFVSTQCVPNEIV